MRHMVAVSIVLAIMLGITMPQGYIAVPATSAAMPAAHFSVTEPYRLGCERQ